MMSIKSLLVSNLLIGAVQAYDQTPHRVSKPHLTELNRDDSKDLSKHNCCLHIKDASDAWWMTNPDVTKEVCKSYYKEVAHFDSKTGTCDELKNGTIKDADWKSKGKIYGTSLGWTDDRVGAGHDATCYPIDA
ncbi:hypothetical protein LB504_011008 [Fusarium proliferatum]|nr:hypothetical protein LB504_011008 [Fusarium proliferatum]